MTRRISEAGWLLIFALVGVALVFVSNIHQQPKVDESPRPSYLDRVIQFCLTPAHENSKLCLVKNPKNQKEVEEAISDSVTKKIQQNDTHSVEPIVVESKTRQVEERTNTQRVNTVRNVAPTAAPKQQPPPTQEPKQQIQLPDVSKVEVPKVEVPKVDVPKPDDLLNNVVTTSK